MPEIKTLYEERFLPQRNDEWLQPYAALIQRAREADETEFRSREFQRELWESDAVASIGPGNSVTVVGAYDDVEIVEALSGLRSWSRPADPKARAVELDERFKRIMSLVSPRHNARRPSARLVRIFAVLCPEDVLCLMDVRRTAQFRQWLELPSHQLNFIGQQTLCRDALRIALGPEKNFQELVSYSQFSWFIWEMLNADQQEGADVTTSSSTREKATDAPDLTLRPARLQRKGMFYVSDNLALLLSVVGASENGIERADLLQHLGDEAPSLNQGSRQNIIAQAVSLGVLAVENGTYRPTAIGQGLLEKDTAADLLTPAFVRTVFGFALILGDLRDKQELTREDIGRNAQSYYPRWTTTFAPNALISWLRELGLASIDGSGRFAKIRLTEKGDYWASGLPATLRDPVHLLSDAIPDDPVADVEREEESLGTPIATLVPAPIAEVMSRFRESANIKRFVFSDQQIRLVHAALHASPHKRFILLAGLSGTGKTLMARAYARAYCEALGLAVEPHFRVIAVWPDWTDPTGLVGYVNPLANPPIFHETPALRFILEASRDPEKPYFLCLDEMNLARVEHYFAPFLSAMEGAGGRLAIHAGDGPVAAVPAQIMWPSNLFIIGTVNMDETTHPFSDKVLDRAFTFEFWHADLAKWRELAAERTPPDILAVVFGLLSSLYADLEKARRHFGYRTCDEVLGFCVAAGEPLTNDVLDAAVLAKVLPKVRGDAGGELGRALEAAEKTCADRGLERSAQKLRDMSASLREFGAVKFWS